MGWRPHPQTAHPPNGGANQLHPKRLPGFLAMGFTRIFTGFSSNIHIRENEKKPFLLHGYCTC
jgi:hypothetical protein